MWPKKVLDSVISSNFNSNHNVLLLKRLGAVKTVDLSREKS